MDSQAIGPSETYDIEDECGSGGCQQGAGDYLVHCYVAHHYLSGMWMIWRVYDTLQDGAASQDSLPRRWELPDRARFGRHACRHAQTRTFTYYAHSEVGETTALLRDWGNVVANPSLGLYGAVIVGPRGAVYTDPVTGEDVGSRSSWRTDVHPPGGSGWRDLAVFIQDQDEIIGMAQMPYAEQVRGPVGVNYRAEPLIGPSGRVGNPARGVQGDPSTPVLEAMTGDAVRVHVLAPSSEQAHVFSIEGHRWPFEPGRQGTPLASSMQIGALDAVTAVFAAAPPGLSGDYLYGDHREPYREAGLWGLFRLRPGRWSVAHPAATVSQRANLCCDKAQGGLRQVHSCSLAQWAPPA